MRETGRWSWAFARRQRWVLFLYRMTPRAGRDRCPVWESVCAMAYIADGGSSFDSLWHQDKLENNYSTLDCCESRDLYIPLNLENSQVSWGTERCSGVPGNHSTLFNTYLKDKGGLVTGWHFSDNHLSPEPDLGLPKNGYKATCWLLCHSGDLICNYMKIRQICLNLCLCTYICMHVLHLIL